MGVDRRPFSIIKPAIQSHFAAHSGKTPRCRPGVVITETVFNIPGIGRLAVQAVSNQDYPYIQGIALLVAAVVLIVNLLVDISYGWLDPRIRYS